MAIGTDVKKQGLRLVHLPSFSVYQNWPVETTFALLKDVSFSPAGYVRSPYFVSFVLLLITKL